MSLSETIHAGLNVKNTAHERSAVQLSSWQTSHSWLVGTTAPKDHITTTLISFLNIQK